VPRDYDDIDFDAIGRDDSGFSQRPVIDLPPLSARDRKKAKRRRRLVFWMKCFAFLFVLFLVIATVGVAGAFFYLKPRYDLAQTFDLSALEEVEVASRIFDRNGRELGRIFVQNRRPVSLDNVSPHFVHALLSAEDSRFYRHDGVDYIGIIRALYYGLRSKGINQGASTITQQLARQTFELKDRTLSRKFTEIFLAQRIERRLGSKQRILELYINRIYFGSGYYGIAAASEGYFGKDPEHLSVVEAATLAATIPNPYHRSPRSFPEVSKKWRDHVLVRMAAEDYIDRDACDRFRKTEVEIAAKTNITGKSAFVYEKVRQEVIDLLGYEAVSKGGFAIHTTIDGGLQEFAETALKEQLAKIEQHPDFKQETMEQYKAKKVAFQESAHPDQTFPAPKYLQGALMVIDNKSGAVLARVSGRDFNDSMFDRVSQGRRPTGTTFMPFVYAAAFEAGYFPGTLVDDTPMDTRQVMVGGTTGILGEWGVESFDNVYENVITSRRALAKGKNAATVRLGQKVGTEAVVNLARKAGMSFSGDLQKFNATFLGRNPSSLEELCLAYTIFPNSGRRAEKPHVIANIRDSLGNIIYTPNVAMHGGQAIDRYTAFQISSMLEDSFKYGTAAKAKEKFGLAEFPVAGKTGTEYDFTDNWFAGYTSEVTCVAWIGFDQSGTIYPGAFSSDTVLPVWATVMNEAAKKYEPKAFLPPPDAEPVEICLKSGELASDDCYEVVQRGEGIASQVRCTYTEHLRPGTNLEMICHLHGKGRSRLQRLTSQQNRKGPLVAGYVVQEDAAPVLPIAPTVIGTDDPYKSLAPVIRARVAPVAAVVVAEEVAPGSDPATDTGAGTPATETLGSDGLPVARPVLTETETQELPAQRVQLPRPRAIEFE
jgi:penicillin-binding protein 1A